MLCTLSLAGILCVQQPVSGQQQADQDKVKQLQAELEKARAQLRELEAQLKQTGGDGKPDAKPVFRLVHLVRGRIAATVTATGTLQPQEVVDIGAQVAGRIIQLGKDKNTVSGHIDFGSEVEGPGVDRDEKVIKQGTVLAQIDPAPFELARDAAKASVLSVRASVAAAEAGVAMKSAALQQATRELERAEKLFKSNGIGQAEYDQVKTALETARANQDASKAMLEGTKAQVGVAEANLRMAQLNLDYTTLSAPISGIVIDRRVNLGQTVAAGLAAPSLFLIAKDLTKLEIWATVNEADVGKIKNGQDVNFTVDAFPGRVFRGKVVPQGKLPFRLNAAMNQNIVTYTVVVSVDNKDMALKPYLTTNVSFIVENKENALLVPTAALRWQPARQQIAPDQRESYFKLKEKKRSATDAESQDQGILWVRGENGFAHYIQVRTGASDGARTEILGVIGDGEVTEKTQVIVGEGRVEGSRPGSKTLADSLPKYLLVMPTGTSGAISQPPNTLSPPRSLDTLTPQDAVAMVRECPAVASAAPVVRVRTQATFGNKKWVPLFIYGTTPSFLDVREWLDLDEGASFTDADVRNGARVCLIGQTIKHELFDDRSPVGRDIRIDNVSFKVLGVLGSRGANAMGLDQDDIVVAPWTTINARVRPSDLSKVKQDAEAKSVYPSAADILYPRTDPLRAMDYPQQTRFANIDQIIVRARRVEDIPLANRQITELLRQRHHIKQGQADDFSVRDMAELMKALQKKEDSSGPSK
jgi:HlyD family secretion protein